MTNVQKWIKILAIVFAVFLTVSILSAIFAGLRGMAFLFDLTSDPVGEIRSYPVQGQIRSVDMKLSAASLTVREGKRFVVESDLNNLTVRERQGKLTVRETSKWLRGKEGNVILTVPSGEILRELSAEAGAGQIEICGISAERLDLELGAGKTRLCDLTVSVSTEIKGGAGKLTVENASFAGLEAELGVGEVEMRAAFEGKSELEFGVGNATLTLLGTKEDYRIRVNKGLGKAEIDGKTASDGDVFFDGNHTVGLSGGIGNVTVLFES